MIADWDMLVIGQQRAIGPEKLSDIRGVVDADIEISVVANLERKLHLHIRLTMEVRFYRSLVFQLR
jgi:hypothetical protein